MRRSPSTTRSLLRHYAERRFRDIAVQGTASTQQSAAAGNRGTRRHGNCRIATPKPCALLAPRCHWATGRANRKAS